MLHVSACLWHKNELSGPYSRCYDESWVDKLYRCFARNLTIPFRFVLFTDRIRKFEEPIDQEILSTSPAHYGCLIEPFKLNVPSIICGLDMVVVRNIAHMAEYCLTADRIAVPIHPRKPDLGICNPVAFVPAGHRHVFDGWDGGNDMVRLRQFDNATTDALWPGQILSHKHTKVRELGLQKARIVYFGGANKMHEIADPWIKEHWI